MVAASATPAIRGAASRVLKYAERKAAKLVAPIWSSEEWLCSATSAPIA